MNKEELLKLYDKYRKENWKVLYEDDYEKLVEHILILHNLDKAELEAKVYTYEKIIANSNFRTILKEPRGVDKE